MNLVARTLVASLDIILCDVFHRSEVVETGGFVDFAELFANGWPAISDDPGGLVNCLKLLEGDALILRQHEVHDVKQIMDCLRPVKVRGAGFHCAFF
jgi:hypothetical protein